MATAEETARLLSGTEVFAGLEPRELEEGAKVAYGGEQAEWWTRLDADHDNEREALAWATANDREIELRLVTALWYFWSVRGHLSEGRRWLDAAIAVSDPAHEALRARAASAAGALAYRQGDYERARALADATLELNRKLGDELETARALGELGNIAVALGEYDRALARYTESSELFRTLGATVGLAFGPDGALYAVGYDRWISIEHEDRSFRERGEMHYRERDWHDLLNALVWLTYPRTKAALNDAQSAASRSAETPARLSPRGARCDALTLFDENGAIVVSTEPTLLDDVRCFRWKELFWKRRSEVERSLRVFVFGHALLHKALAPYIGMTAHALLLSVGEDFVGHDSIAQTAAVDLLAAAAVEEIATPPTLTPPGSNPMPSSCGFIT